MSVYSVPQLIGGITVLLLGSFIFLQRPQFAINRAFGLFSLFTAGWLLTAAMTYSLRYDQRDMALLLLRVSYTCVILIIVPFLRLAIVLVKAPLYRRWERISLALVVIFIWLVWNGTGFIEDLYQHHFGFYPKVGWAHPYFLAWLGVTMVLVHYAFARNWSDISKTDADRRHARQLWIVFGAYTPVIVDFIPNYGIDIYPFGCVFVIGFSLAVAYSIIRHEFLNIRIILRRSLVYSLLIACISAVYLLMVVAMERWFQGFLGYRSVFATLIVAFLIAVFFNPVRERIQTFVDRAILKATPAELATQREQLLVEVRKGDQQKAVATLAAGLAHEVKNPLAAIKTFTEHLGTHYDDPAFRVKFQKIVGGEVERINLIVQQLLEFAKPVPPKLTPLQIEPVLEETLEFLGSELTSRHVQIIRRYATPPATFLGDPKQLKQVLLNLFLNSLQAMNGQGGQLTLTTARAGSELTVTIQDTGCGIAPEHLPHLFTPFYTTKPQGTGLGLAVVQGILKEHGGSIHLTSQVGRGTSATIRLPLAA